VVRRRARRRAEGPDDFGFARPPRRRCSNDRLHVDRHAVTERAAADASSSTLRRQHTDIGFV
jgi:hypothetical protein